MKNRISFQYLSTKEKYFMKKKKNCKNQIKLDKLDVNKLVLVPVDSSKLSDVVKKDVIKKCDNAKIKNFEYKTPDITNVPTILLLVLK